MLEPIPISPVLLISDAKPLQMVRHFLTSMALHRVVLSPGTNRYEIRREQIVRQLLTEGLLLATIAGGLKRLSW